MSKPFEMHSEDQIRRLAALVRKLAEREIGPVSTAPEAQWQMNIPAKDAGQKLRSEIWDSLRDFPKECFPIRLPWLEGTQLEFDHPNETGRQLFVNRSFDPNDFSLLAHFLKPGGTFVDVGANAGLYSVFAARKVGPAGHVLSIEPSRREAASLLRNIAVNRLTNMRCFQLAAGAAEGTALLSVADPEFDGHNALGGLALARVYPNIRYTVDRLNFQWTSFTGRTTPIPIGQVSQLELVIYSDSPFAFVLDDIQFSPSDAVLGPWLHFEGQEVSVRLPHQVNAEFGGAAVTVFGDAILRNMKGALRISCATAGGVVFRWELDPSHSTTATVIGLPLTEDAFEQYEVEVVPLDALLIQPGIPKVDVMKIDVEGFEIEVLNGARKLITQHSPLIIIEVANELLERKSRSATEIASFLTELGYVFFDASSGKPRLVDLMGEHAPNVFAVPETLLDKMLKLGGMTRAALTDGMARID